MPGSSETIIEYNEGNNSRIVYIRDMYDPLPHPVVEVKNFKDESTVRLQYTADNSTIATETFTIEPEAIVEKTIPPFGRFTFSFYQNSTSNSTSI
jgi:hypothetical protein